MKNKCIFLLALAADQITKYAAVERTAWRANTGISFGLFPGFPLWGFVAMICLMLYLKKLYEIKIDRAWALFIAGMSGNLIDRIRLGYVIDWLPLPIMGGLYVNVADAALAAGFACLVLGGLKNLKKQ